MQVIYTPQGDARQEWPYQPYELLNLETEPIEEVGGTAWDSYDEFIEKLRRGNTKAKKALLWTMLRRGNPALRFSDVVYRVDELTLEADPQDLAAARELLKNDSLDPETRAELEAELAELEEEPEIVGKGEPGESGTSST